MKSRFGKMILLAGLSALLLMAQSACTSKDQASNNLPASPTPQASPSPSTSESPAAAGVPANPNTGGGGVPAGSSASNPSGAPTSSGASSNPSTASSASGSTSARPPATAANNPPPPPPPRVYTINSGTPVSVWTTSNLSTKTAKAGDKFTATLANPIVDGDWVVAKKGATVEGTVIDSDPGGKVSGLAHLSLRLDRMTLADGRTVSLETSRVSKEAKSTKKKDAMKVGIGAGIGAAIGAIAGGGKGAAIGAGAGGAAGGGYVLATRGDPAVIPAETQLSFRLTSPVKVTKR